MEILKIEPQGFCYGVKRAIKIAYDTRKQYPNEKIYVLGMLVHNAFVVEELNQLNIITLDTSIKSKDELIDEISEGVLILTAHGTSNNIKQKAIDKGLIVIDAICFDVLKTANVIKNALKNEKEVLYIGKKGHPEAQAMLSIDEERIHLISTKEDLKDIDLNKEYICTCQTTLSFLDVKDLMEEMKLKTNKIEFIPEICSATRKRQEAIINAKDLDAIIVVGDPLSNNTTQLMKLASKVTNHTFKVESKKEININDFLTFNKIGITSGASTPSYLVDEIIELLSQI